MSSRPCARGETETRADAPTIKLDEKLDEEFWRKARVVIPSPVSTSVSLRLDDDVLEWFKEQGTSYVTHINAVLRAYMETQRRERQ